MDFSKVKSIVIPEGNVTKITDTNNTRTIWPVETEILLVDGNGNFVASDTYEISTQYSSASHSTIDVSTNVILPNKGGFMKIYYNYNEDASKSYEPQGDMYILPKKESEVTIDYSKLTCEYAILLYDLDGNIYNKESSKDYKLSAKDEKELKNFVKNNRFAIEALADNDINMAFFRDYCITGGEENPALAKVFEEFTKWVIKNPEKKKELFPQYEIMKDVKEKKPE